MEPEVTPVKGKFQSAEEVAQTLLNNLKKGKETHDIFAKNFRELYKVSGKTVKEWESYYKISVPENPDPQICKMLDMKIMGLYQEAAFLHTEASARVQALKKGSDTEYRARYTALVQEYESSGKKLPARGTLEDLVRSETDNIESALINAEIQKEFWSNIMDHLNMCRRLLENATINSGIEAKMSANHSGNLYDKRADTSSNEPLWR
jgi:hypothetical protein